MKKRIDFPVSNNDTQTEEKIKQVLGREFPLPDSVDAAKKEAFEKIRASQGNTGKKKRSVFGRSAAGVAAAAAVFLGVCISNPALAAQIPLVGHVFERIGRSIDFSGDYAKYAEPLEKEEEAKTSTVSAVPAEKKDGAYSKTINGVTLTVSEVYCNDAAVYVSFVIESEKPFEETDVSQFGDTLIHTSEGTMVFDGEGADYYRFTYFEGNLTDDHTYAGVIRGYPYNKVIPEEFTLKLTIPNIVGDYPTEKCTVPEMPQEFKEEYNAGLEENGLSGLLEDEDVYRTFTEEQKEIEHELYNQMYAKYLQKYPDMGKFPNKYKNWWVDGPWEFEIPVTKNTEDTSIKEINDVDENGIGIASVKKTPFEISVETILPQPGTDYFVTALDAAGDPMPLSDGAGLDTWAIQDRDISKLDIYICNYLEYMDELKVYYWSGDYEEKKKTKTFKELLDERALYHTEVQFEK